MRNLLHNPPVEADPSPLLELFERERTAGRALVLAVVVRTRGSTYRKPGALMAISTGGQYAGLLSGGCLEGDLLEHARAVIASGQAQLVSYDTGGTDDVLWGLGVGCEGSMSILLLRLEPRTHWQPLAALADAFAGQRPCAFAVAVESNSGELPAGTVALPESLEALPAALRERTGALLAASIEAGQPQWLPGDSPAAILAVPLALPPQILLLGAGPDALPIVEIGARLHWKLTVADHRPAYAVSERFPGAQRVVLARPEELTRQLELDRHAAAVVMSHHMPSDLAYLRLLAASRIGYVGLLGPPHRRERLIGELGEAAQALAGRLRAPVGLDIGGRAPESIALAIVAEIHAYLHGRPGSRFSV